MTRILEAPKQDLIEKTAVKLQGVEAVKAPIWAPLVKTGVHKERAPTNDNWWFMRTASILVKVHKLGPIGVPKLRTEYGGKKRRGHKPAEFRLASGSVIRKALQQLEKAGLIKQAEKGVHKGRIITPQGVSLLDQVAKDIVGAKPKKAAPKPEAPKAEPEAAQEQPEQKAEEPKESAPQQQNE